MKIRTNEEQRARIANINAAEENNRSCFRRHRIRDYLCAHAVYNLGDYPLRIVTEPTEYDINTIREMAEGGVQLIQLHEDWNDGIRRFGADKYSSCDPKGLEHFIDLCHENGIKVIPYVSSGYLHQFDPDMRPEFAQTERYCANGSHFKYRRCSAGSAQWRNFIYEKTFGILDRYDFDGIYNDLGTDSSYTLRGCMTRPGLGAYDPEIEDFLGTIYHEVKRRGGVYKLHCDCGNNGAPCLDKVYDYLWIGEAIRDLQFGIGKEYDDYVIPCQDKGFMTCADPDFYFACTIPFLQFPLLTCMGRPYTGRRVTADVPKYGKVDPNSKNYRVKAYTDAHPDGPFVHSLWSAIPDDPAEFGRWRRYLALYKPMVEEDSLVYVDLKDCADILSPLSGDVCASMFVNEKIYLAVTSVSPAPYTLRLRGEWRDRVSGETGSSFSIGQGKILFLEKR